MNLADPADVARAVEELAANAWPASIVQIVDGWRLRATPGIDARRSNSVLPTGGSSAIDLDDKLALVDAFYAARELPVRFQMSPAAVPADLDELLAERGLGIEAPVDVMVADLAEVDASATGGTAVEISDEPEDVWLDTMLGITARGERWLLRSAVLDRIGPSARYAWVPDGDRAIAVGMGVVERGWLGIFSMATVPDRRRRGHARSVLHALAEFGLTAGATRAYLQTERGNATSHALYEGAGFRTAYGYHYRTRR